MADRKITDLTALAAGSQATGDLLTIVDVSEAAATDKNKKITVESLFKGIPSNVGIGTASPSSKLHIAASTPILNIESSASSGDGAQIRFTQNFNRVGRLYMTSEAGTSSGAMHLESPEVRDIVFKGTSTERCRITRYGKLLVGTTIEGAANADNLTIADSGHAGMTIRSGTSSLGGLYFSDGTSGAAEYQGVVEYNHSTNALVLFANAAEGLRIDNSQNIGIGVAPSAWGGSRNAIQFDSAGAAYLCNDSTMGIASNFYFDGSTNRYINAGSASALYVQNDNIVFDFAGSGSDGASASFNTRVRIDNDGLKFGTDTAATNALDDYEEGAWTPDLRFGGGTTGITYANRFGKYVKIGRLVWVTCRVGLSNKGSSTGNAQVFGLPFGTSTESSTHLTPGAIWFSSASVQGSPQQTTCRTDGNNQGFIEFKNLTTGNEDVFDHSDVNNDFQFAFQVTYLSQ